MRTRRAYVLFALGSISCALVAGLDDKELAIEPDGGVAVARPDGSSAPCAAATRTNTTRVSMKAKIDFMAGFVEYSIAKSGII